MVNYELVKVTIDAPGLVEVMIRVVVRHQGLHVMPWPVPQLTGYM